MLAAIEENVPLAPRTTLGVGGPARYFVDAIDPATVTDALAWARAKTIPVLVFAGGSNLLVSDRGFDGLALRVRVTGIDRDTGGEGAALAEERLVHWRVGAGEMLDVVVAHAVDQGLAGLECLSGIPGCVGATPIQNVGAYGQDVSESIVHVNTIDRVTGALRTFDNASCGFAYRSSVFKEALAGRHVVLYVTFALRAAGIPVLRYPELQRHFAPRTPSLAEVREAVIGIRRSKSMVIAADDPNRRSVGSFFVNPTVSVEHGADVERRASPSAGAMPRFAAGDGLIKLSAAWLIERAGFSKGDGDGPVGISTRHALSIVNRGGATASQIVDFATRIRAKVYEAFGVTLRPEPSLVGFHESEIRELIG